MILDRTTTAHTGVDVPLTASGPGGRELVGNYENTHVYDAMGGALGIPTAQRAKAAA